MAETSLYNLLSFLNHYSWQNITFFSKKSFIACSLSKVACLFQLKVHMLSWSFQFRNFLVQKVQRGYQRNLSSYSSTYWELITLSNLRAGAVVLL